MQSPNSRVLLLLFLPCALDSAEGRQLADQRDRCHDYAQAHQLDMVDEVVVSACEHCLNVDNPAALERIQRDLSESTVDALLLAWEGPVGLESDVIAAMVQWIEGGVPVHSPEYGRFSRDELLRWLQHTWESAHSWTRYGHVDRLMADDAPSPMSYPMVNADESGRANYMADEPDFWDAPAADSYPSMAHSYPSASSAYPTHEEVPLRSMDEALPHDGLFVRRNNAFGTRSTLGIVDLIDQGVLIDQSQIRFDDFVTDNADPIPGPAPGAAIAVSHGAAGVSGGFTTHEHTTHLVELALKAASGPLQRQSTGTPIPVNFVFVVDTSDSMGGEKLDSVKVAIRELYGQLRDTDVLGIVTFDSQVRTVLRASPKSQLSPDRLAALVGQLYPGGATDINLGIRYGIDEIRRHGGAGADYVNHLYVFSDGDPTSGELNWIKIRTNVAAQLRGDITLSCFGFGSDARMRELNALAGLSGGHSTFVTQPNDVRLNLTEDLTRREHLAAINIQLKIEISPDITIWHLYGHDLVTNPTARAAVNEDARAVGRRARDEYGVDPLPDLINDETGLRIFAPDLAFGETYWIVFELQVPPGVQPPSFGTATVQYLDTQARQNINNDLVLTAEGPISADIVLAHAIGMQTSEVTFYALDDLYQNDRATAKSRLSNHINTLRLAYSYRPLTQFRDDQVTVSKLVSLAENLGQPIRWSEDIGTPMGVTMFALNQFGQARSGYLTTRQR